MNDFSSSLRESAFGEIGFVSCSDFHCAVPLSFALGGGLKSFDIRYETYGKLNAEKSNAILVCHALTGDHHCAGIYSLTDKKAGWWNNIIGPNKPLDTNKYFIILTLEGALYMITQINLLILHMRKQPLKFLFH